LGLDRFERVQGEGGADQYSSQDDSDCKMSSHGTWFLSQGRRRKNTPDAIGAQEPPNASSNHHKPKINSKSPHARQAHADFAVFGSDFPVEATVM
jgi:hypothetical protein